MVLEVLQVRAREVGGEPGIGAQTQRPREVHVDAGHFRGGEVEELAQHREDRPGVRHAGQPRRGVGIAHDRAR